MRFIRRRGIRFYGCCPDCGHDWREHPGGAFGEPAEGFCGECRYKVEHDYRETDAVAQAFDGVEQGQLRAGVGSFAAHEVAGAGRVAVVRDEAGQFTDFGAVAGFAVAVEGRRPGAVCLGGEDGLTDRFGDCHPDENRASTPSARSPRMWASRPNVQPAESERIRIGVPCRWLSGIWVRAWSRTVM